MASTTVFWSANTKNKHGQSQNDKGELDVLAIDLLYRHYKESEFIFHWRYPFVWCGLNLRP